MGFLLIPFFLKVFPAGEMHKAIDFDQNFDSARTINSNETSTVIFLTSDPIIDITDTAVNESEIVEQLELGSRIFESEFLENILSSLDGEMIGLFDERLLLDRIMIIGVLNAFNITIGYYSGKGSMDYSVNPFQQLKWILYSVGVVTVPKSCDPTAKGKPLFLAAEYRYEGTPEIEKITKILDADVSTSSSIIKENLNQVLNESDIIHACKSQDECNLSEKINLALSEDVSMAIFEINKSNTEVDILEDNNFSCGENFEYADPVENALEKEASILQSLENLNVGKDKTLIENFASITVEELE